MVASQYERSGFKFCPGPFLCQVCIILRCLRGFSSGAPLQSINMHIRLIGDFHFAVGCERECEWLSMY